MAGRTFEIFDEKGSPLIVDVDDTMTSFAVANARGDLIGTGTLIRRHDRFEIRDCSFGVSDEVMDTIEEELNGVSSSGSGPVRSSARN